MSELNGSVNMSGRGEGKIIICDFDGTLIKNNSFPDWVLFAARRSLLSFRFDIFFCVLFLLVKRKILRDINHDEFKRGIDGIDYPLSWGRDFCLRLKSGISEAVLDKILEVNLPVVILTAAPSCYGKYISTMFGFSIVDVYTSGFLNGVYCCNFGIKKLSRFNEVFQGVDYVLFSDHEDDFFLAKASRLFFLCNPTADAVDFYNKNGIEYFLIEG